MGPVHVRAFTWLSSEDITPEIAEATLVNETRTWIAAGA